MLSGRTRHVLFLHIIIGSVLYPWVNCTWIRTLNPGFRGSPLTHGYKTDPIMIHKRVHAREAEQALRVHWPLHAIAITNIVWSMAFRKGVGGDRVLRNRRAIVLQ